jgi:hypothetical protein
MMYIKISVVQKLMGEREFTDTWDEDRMKLL